MNGRVSLEQTSAQFSAVHKPLSRAGSDSVGPYTFDRLGLSNASESGGQSLSRAMRVYSAYSAYRELRQREMRALELAAEGVEGY